MAVPEVGGGAYESPRRDVLVVDDDRLALEMISEPLRGAGYAISTFLDPAAALRALESTCPAVIVSDYVMPSMDGISFLSRARERVPEATRVLCTATTDFDVALAAVNMGKVYRIVRKPCRPDELLETVADAAGCAASRAHSERVARELDRRNASLLEVNARLEKIARERTENLLEGLVAALDCRDSETQWHSRRVARYARRLAAQVGVREPELTVIERGALLHDVGKIGVRDDVLRKPGALTPQEWEEMRKHPALGWSLLRAVEWLRPAATIVLQHHERWDGTGYPARLGGTNVSLGARIFHVVDALDAITSDRPYRKARPVADACDEIARLAGSHFDPKVVEAFMALNPSEWDRIRVDVETVAILSAELVGARAPAAHAVDVRSDAEQAQWAKKRLGELLVELRVIDRQQLASALEYQRWHRCKLGVALIELGFAREDQVLSTLARKLGYDRIHLDSLQWTPTVEAALQLVPGDLASSKGIVPIACDRTTLTVALRDPADLALVDELAFRAGRRVRVLVAGEAEVTRAVSRLYSRSARTIDLDVIASADEDLQLVPVGAEIW